jgi:hypothetical protein
MLFQLPKMIFSVSNIFMKSTLCSIVVVFVLCNNLIAQPDSNIPPQSKVVELFGSVPLVTLPRFDYAAAAFADSLDDSHHKFQKFSRSVPANVSIQQSGHWSDVSGGRVCRVDVLSQSALALIPFFNKFVLPEGATLHIYSKEELIGAFTHQNSTDGAYCTGLIHGDKITLEYFEPTEQRGKGDIFLEYIGHAYRWVKPVKSPTRDFGDADNCQVNINCTEGANWQNQKRSVVRILVNEGTSQGWCTGAMVNNTRQDCIPYLLSAQHCSFGSDSLDMLTWVFYYNYESQNCTNPVLEGTLGLKFITGARKISDSNDNGGESGSDFLLLRLLTTPPANYNVFYSGWNTTTTTPQNGVCIHHPSGDIKKISTFNSASSSNWGFVNGSHWQLSWVSTTNGHGVTEPGSSGAALFNSSGEIVGALTGGDSFCSAPEQPDLFGKFSFSWVSNGTPNNERLKPWLDPDNTGVSSISGASAGCISSVSEALNYDAVKIYPNPAKDEITLSLNKNFGEAATFTLCDFAGSVVMQQTLPTNADCIKLKVAGVSDGIYVGKIKSGNSVLFQQKLLIVK